MSAPFGRGMLLAYWFKEPGLSLTPFPAWFLTFPSSFSFSPHHHVSFPEFLYPLLLLLYSSHLFLSTDPSPPIIFLPPSIFAFFQLISLFISTHSLPYSSSTSCSLLAYWFPITRTLTILLTLSSPLSLSLHLSVYIFFPSLTSSLPPSLFLSLSLHLSPSPPLLSPTSSNFSP